jgi:hypothetical protein
MLGGIICLWLLIFQDFEFEVIFMMGKYNVGPYNFSWIESSETIQSLYDELLDAQIFCVDLVHDQLAKNH